MKKSFSLVVLMALLVVALVSCNADKHVEDSVYGTWKTSYHSEANGYMITSNLRLAEDSSFTLVTTASIVNPALCRAYLLSLGTYDADDLDTQVELQEALASEFSHVAYGTFVLTDTYVLLFVMEDGMSNEVPFVRGSDGTLHGANMTWKRV